MSKSSGLAASAAAAFGVLGCGGGMDPPVITDVTVSASSVDEGAELSMTVTAMGEKLTYQWAGGGSFDDPMAAETTWTAPIVSRTSHMPPDEDQSLEILVENPAGSAMETVDVSVLNVNEPPEIATAAAAGEAAPKPGTDVALTVGADDPEGDPLTYAWSQTGPASPAGTLSGEDTDTATWRAPAVAEATSFTFEVTITDGESDPVTGQATTEVQPATFAADVIPVLGDNGVNCDGCHAAGSGGLTFDLDGDPSGTLTTWLNNTASVTCGGNTYSYIEPGDPQSSTIFLKISGMTCEGDQMPRNNSDYFTDPSGDGPQELYLIESWILAGAQDN